MDTTDPFHSDCVAAAEGCAAVAEPEHGAALSFEQTTDSPLSAFDNNWGLSPLTPDVAGCNVLPQEADELLNGGDQDADQDDGASLVDWMANNTSLPIRLTVNENGRFRLAKYVVYCHQPPYKQGCDAYGDNIKNLGGCGKGRNGYQCLQCQVKWSQLHPDAVLQGGDPAIKLCHKAVSDDEPRRSGGYRCKSCRLRLNPALAAPGEPVCSCKQKKNNLTIQSTSDQASTPFELPPLTAVNLPSPPAVISTPTSTPTVVKTQVLGKRLSEHTMRGGGPEVEKVLAMAQHAVQQATEVSSNMRIKRGKFVAQSQIRSAIGGKGIMSNNGMSSYRVSYMADGGDAFLGTWEATDTIDVSFHDAARASHQSKAAAVTLPDANAENATTAQAQQDLDGLSGQAGAEEARQEDVADEDAKAGDVRESDAREGDAEDADQGDAQDAGEDDAQDAGEGTDAQDAGEGTDAQDAGEGTDAQDAGEGKAKDVGEGESHTGEGIGGDADESQGYPRLGYSTHKAALKAALSKLAKTRSHKQCDKCCSSQPFEIKCSVKRCQRGVCSIRCGGFAPKTKASKSLQWKCAQHESDPDAKASFCFKCQRMLNDRNQEQLLPAVWCESCGDDDIAWWCYRCANTTQKQLEKLPGEWRCPACA